MNGYTLTRAWFDFCFENPEKIKPNHHAIYLYAVDLNNRLGWKEKFRLPTNCTMEVSGIKNHRTYKSSLDDLISWGFINLIQKSKNQFTANVIALGKNTKATSNALDKAIQLQDKSTETVDKQLNQKQLNTRKLSEIKISEVPEDLKIYFEKALIWQNFFIRSLELKNAPIKKLKEAKFGHLVNPLRLMIQKDEVSFSQLDKALIFLESKDGQFWRNNILTIQKLREKIGQVLMNKNEYSQDILQKNSNIDEKLKGYE